MAGRDMTLSALLAAEATIAEAYRQHVRGCAECSRAKADAMPDKHCQSGWQLVVMGRRAAESTQKHRSQLAERLAQQPALFAL